MYKIPRTNAPYPTLPGCVFALDTRTNAVKLFDLTRNIQVNVSGATSVAGLYGNNLLFNGGTNRLGTAGDIPGTGSVTIEAWIKVSGFGGGGTGNLINNGKLAVNVNVTGAKLTITSNNYSNSVNSADNAITLGSWHHIVITRTSAGVANIYINGAQSGTANGNSGTPAAGTTDTIIGNRNAADKGFQGNIKNLNIYNRILTQAEITQLYRQSAYEV